LSGYRKAYAEFKVEHDPSLIVEPASVSLDEAELAQSNAQRLMAVKPDAIFVGNDGEAMWMIRALVDCGVRVPQDVAMVSADRWDVGRSYVPRLTSIDMNSQEMGRIAMTMLLNKINSTGGEQALEKTILPPRLVIGESCGSQLKTR